MSLKVIEFNDRAIRIGDETGIVLTSPGFALVDNGDDGEVHLGDEAEQQARLKPTSSYNKFWQQLSLDPVSYGSHGSSGSPGNQFRHYADIAHAHLCHLAEIGQIESEVIFAVPGSFTREQLSILLGLARHSPLNPVGLVDSALAACLTETRAATVIYAELQLHQVVLTRLRREAGQLKIDQLVQVPGVGSQNFMDLIMQIATTQFIQQSRFNPQHNAESEQQLYNALPAWLRQDETEGNLLLDLNSGSANYSAKMPRESLVSALSGHYDKIRQQIDALATGRSVQVLLSPALAELPGVLAALSSSHPEVGTVAADALIRCCLAHQELIIGGGEAGLHLVTSLPLEEAETHTPAADTAAAEPTHILFRHRALPLTDLTIRNGKTNGSSNGDHGVGPGQIVMDIKGLPDTLAAIQKQSDGIYLDSGEQEYFINREKHCGRHKLALGDTIQFSAGGDGLSLIQVSHG